MTHSHSFSLLAGFSLAAVSTVALLRVLKRNHNHALAKVRELAQELNAKVPALLHPNAYPRYRSSRGQPAVDFETAVRQGLGLDGGLLVPTHFPQVNRATLESWYGLSFQDLAFEVMSLYVPREQVSAEALRGIIRRSYETFRHEEVTPVVKCGEEGQGPKVLELFHGPTFAFKDVALQFLGNLFEHFISQKGDSITVLGATSGDTGSSAIYGLRGKKGVDVFILYPEGRVSPIQEKQMITVTDRNVNCLAVEGTFDDAQAIVKALFRDGEFRDEVKLAAVNSINWARILAQIVYYFYAYLRTCPKPTASSQPLQKISFSVPTGNFGDILAGFYAKQMGLPVDQLIVATNENDILHNFFSKGEYFRPTAVSPTIAPSMDICVSSNFERFLFHMNGDDPEKMAEIMQNFEKTNKLKADKELLSRCQEQMISARLSQAEIKNTIREVEDEFGYLLDPHSAIGVGAVKKLKAEGKVHEDVPMICLACAHWAKFTKAVDGAIGKERREAKPYPPALTKLETMPTKKKILKADKQVVKEHILSIRK